MHRFLLKCMGKEMKCKMWNSRLILVSASYAVAMVIQYQMKKKLTGGDKTKLLMSVNEVV